MNLNVMKCENVGIINDKISMRVFSLRSQLGIGLESKSSIYFCSVLPSLSTPALSPQEKSGRETSVFDR